ncbi:MAG TPA: hypothetical protein VKA87_04010 [Nitrososphaeraceae archaeon]|nr:hypothetical protein [Nitrososphaeraceae archaeon]
MSILVLDGIFFMMVNQKLGGLSQSQHSTIGFEGIAINVKMYCLEGWF